MSNPHSSKDVNCKPAYSVVKVTQALAYLLSLDDNKKMERVKLIKLLWAADRMHIRRYGRTISESSYYAMYHGPVCSLALDIAQNSKYSLSDDDVKYIDYFFTSDSVDTAMSKNPGDDYLSNSDKEVLKQAFDTFSTMKTFELADRISHNYPEWKKFEPVFVAGNRSSHLIDKEDFFKNPDSDNLFEDDNDTLNAAHEAFQERRLALDAINRSGEE